MPKEAELSSLQRSSRRKDLLKISIKSAGVFYMRQQLSAQNRKQVQCQAIQHLQKARLLHLKILMQKQQIKFPFNLLCLPALQGYKKRLPVYLSNFQPKFHQQVQAF